MAATMTTITAMTTIGNSAWRGASRSSTCNRCCCYVRGRLLLFSWRRAAIPSFAKQSCSMQKRTVGKSVMVDVRPIARLSRNDQRAWYIKSPFNGNARFPNEQLTLHIDRNNAADLRSQVWCCVLIHNTS